MERPSYLSDALIAGSLSGGITRLVGSPLDVLKIRFQLQLEPIKVMHAVLGYRLGMQFLLSLVCKTEALFCSLLGWSIVKVFWSVECYQNNLQRGGNHSVLVSSCGVAVGTIRPVI